MGLMKTKVIGVWLKNWRDKGMPDNIWLYGFDGFNGLKTVGFVIANTDTEAEHKVWRMYNDFGQMNMICMIWLYGNRKMMKIIGKIILM